MEETVWFLADDPWPDDKCSFGSTTVTLLFTFTGLIILGGVIDAIKADAVADSAQTTMFLEVVAGGDGARGDGARDDGARDDDAGDEVFFISPDDDHGDVWVSDQS